LAQRPAAHGARTAPDTSAFALLIRTAAADTSREWWQRRMHVNPRPLRNDREVTDVWPSEFAPAMRAELATRSRTIRALGMIVDETEKPKNCGGTLSPTPRKHERDGCPSGGGVITLVGRPRRGDVLAPADGAPDTTRWTARVLRWSIGASGYNVFSADYVIERRDGRWRLVGIKPVGWVE
jgi:hypothetical protein